MAAPAQVPDDPRRHVRHDSTGGGLQATYDGHPLYAYIGDRGPGQANGNDLDLNGGFWYDIRMSH